MNKHEDILKDMKEKLGLNDEFCEKLLLIERLTMRTKEEDQLQSEGKLGKYEHLSNDNLPTSFADTTFRLRTALLSLLPKELKIVQDYLKDDFWFPSEHSAGSY